MQQVETHQYHNQNETQTVQIEQPDPPSDNGTQTICSDPSMVPQVNSIATIPSSTITNPSTTNRTYLQCYSREANKNLVSWADQMSMALRDSVAHLDQICMRVRSCLSDLEANEIRYLHMQRRPSPMQLYQPPTASSLLQSIDLFAVTPDCHHQEPDQLDHVEQKEVEFKVTEPLTIDPLEWPAMALVEIESPPFNTPVIIEPLAIQETARPPTRNFVKRPKSRRGGNSSRQVITSSSKPITERGVTDKPKILKRKIATVEQLKPIISVREHLEMTKSSGSSSRQVYKKIFRNKTTPSAITMPQMTRLPTQSQISRPKSILKVPNKFTAKSAEAVIKSDTGTTTKNTIKNKENQKFNDSLWFKEKKTPNAKLQEQCGCKVIVECPRVPVFTTPRTSYNAQSRLQWIRAKNSLVLEYGKTHAADNLPSTTSTVGMAAPPPPIDILDAINDDLVQPLRSEYPRKDSDMSTGERKEKGELVDGAICEEHGDELLRELLLDPSKLRGLVQSSSRRAVTYSSNSPRPSPVIKLNSPYIQQIPVSNSARLHRLRMQHKRKQKNLLKQRKQEQLQQENNVPFPGTAAVGEAGDLMLGKSAGNSVRMSGGKKRKEMGGKCAGRGSRSGSGPSTKDDKENIVPISQTKASETGFSSWANMSPHDIKAKLMPFLIPDHTTYTVLPVTEIIYDRKPPVPGQPPTAINKRTSSAQLNSTQKSTSPMTRRGKPRSLYTDVNTQKKLDSYLELRDNIVYPKTVYTTLPAVTITTPTTFSSHNCCSARHSAHQHNHHQHHSHARRHTAAGQSTSTTSNPIHRGTANPHHKRHSTTSGSMTIMGSTHCGEINSTNGASVGTINVEQHPNVERKLLMGAGLVPGSVGWLDKARRAKTSISAATRRDIGSSIQQLEDKIAELISDPSKIGDGKAFDDVEQDIVRMLNKINTPREESEAATTTDDLVQSQISTSPKIVENIPQAKVNEMVTEIAIASAIDLVESSQMTDIAKVMKKTTDKTKESEVPNYPKYPQMGDIPEARTFTPVPCDALQINAGLDRIGKFLCGDQQSDTKPEQGIRPKSPRKEPSMQPIYEYNELSTKAEKVSLIDKDISAIGSPRKVFKIENIPEYVSVDSLSQISDFPYVTNIRKQQRDDSAESKISVSGPELKRLRKLDGTSGKIEQELIVSTDNLCSIESDQFVTPFMKVVRKYRQEDSHDNFMQFLDALTQLSQENTTVLDDSNKIKFEIKDISLPDISNPFYNDMKVTTFPINTENPPTIEVKYVNPQTDLSMSGPKVNLNPIRTDSCFIEASTILRNTDNICSQLVEFILNRCKSYIDRRVVLENKSKGNAATPRGLLLKFVYTVFFTIVFMAMKLNWNCLS